MEYIIPLLALICFVLIAVVFVLTWRATQRANRRIEELSTLVDLLPPAQRP